MTQRFATGKHAFGYCDVCDQRYDLAELRTVYVNLVATGIKACPQCWDPDHPQLQIGRYPVDDPQALFDPRPNDNLAMSRGLFGWDPLYSQQAHARVGNVGWTIT